MNFNNIKKISLIFLFLFSCKANDKIYLYKVKGFTDYIIGNYFPWDYKDDIDSMRIKNFKRLNKIILKSNTRPSIFKYANSALPIMPDYAIIFKYKGRIDTIHFNYDFKSAYLSNSGLMIDSLDAKFYKLLYKKHKEFMDRTFEYYDEELNPDLKQ